MQTCGVDYRTAYQVVGIAVRTAHAAGLRGVDLDGAMLDAAAEQHAGRPLGLAGRDLSEVLDPRRIVATRTAAGGAAPPVVEAMAASCREQAAELLDLAQRRRNGFRASERRLVERATEVADEPGGSAMTIDLVLPRTTGASLTCLPASCVPR